MRINKSTTNSFLLLGFSSFPSLEGLFFTTFFIIYFLILIGNAFIIVITLVDQTLHSPMYFFLRNLSCLEICYTSIIIPKMLENILSEDKTISFINCAFQMSLFLITGAAECFLLAAMAYDRYVAICQPLHYSLIMNSRVCSGLVGASWLAGIPVQLSQTFLVFASFFCNSNEINHFFCDIPALLNLICGDTTINEQVALLEVILLALIPFAMILMSYICIAITILKIPSVEGRHKAFSTCSSHLTVVLGFYGSGIIVYVTPKSRHSLDKDKYLSLFYTVLSPLVNPLIYSLRNREIQIALGKVLYLFCSYVKLMHKK
ncbi:olfactory receptor 10A2-like [Protobothrops mucrosquamatus]|uniref:olfactory receptor 10A2-like n=1 Tax=Protobothrops mucrosquamatus TaxID=103944 RepID=UPI000775CEF2|nr:olfactory receptor 10A2-like [Protobothrops mucrosquamatus]